jgi:16S rRNA (adenine1518-N6/adenine1519-N6)-dimethyltransferase
MKPKIGQNFLVDRSVLDFEAKEADVPGKGVLEIGAGDGRLTRQLLANGAKSITACELDRKLAAALRKRFNKNGKVRVWEGDFLEFPEGERHERVVGNIPYYITTPIIFKLARMDFGSALLCVQKEVAKRMAAAPGSGNYGRLSVSCQLCFSVELLAIVPRSAFEPVPKVDSCIVRLTRTGFSLGKRDEKAIAAIFSHRKKSLRNAVIDARAELFHAADKKEACALAEKLKYAARKVFTLSPQEALHAARELRGGNES